MQDIRHLLNRISFGPRPGDKGHVEKIGAEKYIDQQLHPEGIADPTLGRRLSGFEVLNRSPADLGRLIT